MFGVQALACQKALRPGEADKLKLELQTRKLSLESKMKRIHTIGDKLKLELQTRKLSLELKLKCIHTISYLGNYAPVLSCS